MAARHQTSLFAEQTLKGASGHTDGTAAYTLSNGDRNKLLDEDRPAHDWYRFILSFPPQLVRHYLGTFGVTEGDVVLDPFCGTGTTVVECKKLGIPSIGLEAHPMAAFASRTKAQWQVEPGTLASAAATVAAKARERIDGAAELLGLPEPAHVLLLKDSVSPLPLHKSLVLLNTIGDSAPPACREHMRLALAKALVNDIGNLRFGPEVGIGTIREDAEAVGSWLANVSTMVSDLRLLSQRAAVGAEVVHHDSRDRAASVERGSVSAVITSPPYPNEKDYTRTTRLETVVLGLLRDRQELRALKQGLLRSNTRNVYKGDDDDRWIRPFPEITELAAKIEQRRVELGKTSGFERQYARVTALYFGGMARHLADLRGVLRNGARLAYVVGDQASFLRVMIRTGSILAGIAKSLGYRVLGIDLFRTRFSTATKEQLREEALLLEWP